MRTGNRHFSLHNPILNLLFQFISSLVRGDDPALTPKPSPKRVCERCAWAWGHYRVDHNITVGARFPRPYNVSIQLKTPV